MNIYLKFGDGGEPNLFRVKKVDVHSTFIENIFRSGLINLAQQTIQMEKVRSMQLRFDLKYEKYQFI